MAAASHHARHIARRADGNGDAGERLRGSTNLSHLISHRARGRKGHRQHRPAGHLCQKYGARFEFETRAARAVGSDDGVKAGLLRGLDSNRAKRAHRYGSGRAANGMRAQALHDHRANLAVHGGTDQPAYFDATRALLHEIFSAEELMLMPVARHERRRFRRARPQDAPRLRRAPRGTCSTRNG